MFQAAGKLQCSTYIRSPLRKPTATASDRDLSQCYVRSDPIDGPRGRVAISLLNPLSILRGGVAPL